MSRKIDPLLDKNQKCTFMKWWANSYEIEPTMVV